MKHLLDKAVLLVVCCSLVAWQTESVSTGLTVSLLLCIVASAVFEFMGTRIRFICPLVICVIVAVAPFGPSLLPLAAYDLTRFGLDRRGMRDKGAKLFLLAMQLPWLLAFSSMMVVTRGIGLGPAVSSFAACLGACLLSVRTGAFLSQETELHALRDSLQEKIDLLNRRNGELTDARDQAARVATLTERSRISREIHDNVGHLLTRSLLQVEAFKVASCGKVLDEEALESVSSTLHEALDSTRISVHAMADDSFDLALELHHIMETSGIAHDELVYDVEEGMPADIARCLFAVVRESLTNATRHGHATEVQVRVSEFPALWQLMVTSDCRVPVPREFAKAGDLTAVLSLRGMGIRSMQERVEMFGGTFHVSGDRDFKVFVSIPRKEMR